MWYYIFKVLSSAIIIVLISEISKRSSFWGSVLASVPLMSFLAFIWLYIDTRDVTKVSELSTSIFWMVIPSLSYFVTFPFLLRKNVQFFLAMLISTIVMVLFYFLMIFVLKKFGIKI